MHTQVRYDATGGNLLSPGLKGKFVFYDKLPVTWPWRGDSSMSGAWCMSRRIMPITAFPGGKNFAWRESGDVTMRSVFHQTRVGMDLPKAR